MSDIARSPEKPSPEPGPGRAAFRRHAAAWFVLSIVGALLFADSFQRWGHPIIDLGRDLYLPAQILQGRVLYQELLYNYGPTFPYLMAGIIAVFGDGLAVFTAVGLIFGILTTMAVYAIGNLLGGRVIGFVSGLLCLVFSFFAMTYGWNFVLPYAYPPTMGTALALWSYYFLHRHLYCGHPRGSLAWSVGLMFAAVFTKHEIGLAIGLVHAASWWSHGFSPKTIAKILGAGAALVIVFLVVFAADEPGDHTLISENVLRYTGNVKDLFFQRVAGLDQPARNIAVTLRMTARLAAIVLSASLAGAAFSVSWKRRAVWIGAGVTGASVCAWLIWKYAAVSLFQATLPLALIVLLYYGVKDKRSPLMLLSLFVVLSALRIPLKFCPVYFGFYLFVPAYPFLVHTLVQKIAPRLPGRRVVVCALGALTIVMLIRFETLNRRANQAMTSVLTTPKGTMRDFPIGQAEAIGEFLQYIETRYPDQRPTMVVFPEGVSLNYFTDMPNPTAYYLFTPPEVNSPTMERRIVEELKHTRPQYIAITSRSTSEFGMEGFGFGYGYGASVFKWINSAYSVERTFRGPEETQWWLALLRRNDPPVE